MTTAETSHTRGCTLSLALLVLAGILALFGAPWAALGVIAAAAVVGVRADRIYSTHFPITLIPAREF